MHGHSMFPGDQNLFVKQVQFDTVDRAWWIVWGKSRDLYALAEQTLALRTELGDVAREYSREFGMRPLLQTLRQIAAYFRFRCAETLAPELPGISKEDEPDRIRRLWFEFLENEVQGLIQCSGEFVRNVIIAVCHANTVEGLAAEAALDRDLKDRYKDMYTHTGIRP